MSDIVPTQELGARKRKASERVTGNGDPLVAKKKARDAALAAKEVDPRKAKNVSKIATSTQKLKAKSVADDLDDQGLPSARTTSKAKKPVILDSDDEDDPAPALMDLSDDEDEEDEDENMVVEQPAESAEAEMTRLSKEWTSPIYAFYKPTPEIEYVSGRRVHRFNCAAKYCKGKNGRGVRRYLDTADARSTSNLRKHAKACWGEDVIDSASKASNVHTAREILAKTDLASSSITDAFACIPTSKVTYSHRQHTTTESRAEIVRWVSESKRPFQIVKDRGYQCLMKTGRPDYHIPSPETVSRDVKRVFVNVRNRLASLLKNYDGALSFATDAWTSPNHKAFIAITVHFQYMGGPISLLLDLVELPKSHSGENIAEAFADVLKEFGIDDKARCIRRILGITADNASNNDAMIEELSSLLEDFPGAANQTRCFLHILNLVAKSILSQFESPSSKKGAGATTKDAVAELLALADELEEEGEGRSENEVGDGDGDGDDEEDKAGGDSDEEDDPENDDVEGWVDERDSMDTATRKRLDTDIIPLRKVLLKLRHVALKIKNSTTIVRPKWDDLLEELVLRARIMPRDVATRWNSTYDMLVFSLNYRVALDALAADRKTKLREFELDDKEWNMAVQLRDILKILKDATLFFSRHGTPSISTVIPAMDYIDEHLATASKQTSLSPAICAAVALGKRTLNRYYNKTDHSEVYRIAMILHPRHKLEYFKRAGWEDSWTDAAKDIVRKEYDRTYAFADVAVPLPTPSVPAAGSVSGNIFDNLPSLSAPTASEQRDELDRYLSVDTEPVVDAIAWWSERRATFPHLAQMAIDYLCIPATSVGVERIFSKGRLVLPHVRSRLSVQSVRALMCLGEWSLLGFIKDSDIKAVTRLPEIPEGEAEEELASDWDAIQVL